MSLLFSQMIHQRVSDEPTLNLAMDIITELDPDDYLYFIENGKKRNRKIQSQQCESDIKPTKGTLHVQKPQLQLEQNCLLFFSFKR